MTITRSFARTVSFTVQSMVTFCLTVSTSSWAMHSKVLVAQDHHGAVVGFQGVVEGEFVVGQPEVLAALLRLLASPWRAGSAPR